MQRPPECWLLRASWRIPAHSDATRKREPQQRVGHLVLRNKFRCKLLQSVCRERNSYFEELRPAPKPLKVLLPAKWFAVEHTHRFEEPVAIKKTAVENRDNRRLFRNELTVEEDEHGEI